MTSLVIKADSNSVELSTSGLEANEDVRLFIPTLVDKIIELYNVTQQGTVEYDSEEETEEYDLDLDEYRTHSAKLLEKHEDTLYIETPASANKGTIYTGVRMVFGQPPTHEFFDLMEEYEAIGMGLSTFNKTDYQLSVSKAYSHIKVASAIARDMHESGYNVRLVVTSSGLPDMELDFLGDFDD